MIKCRYAMLGSQTIFLKRTGGVCAQLRAKCPGDTPRSLSPSYQHPPGSTNCCCVSSGNSAHLSVPFHPLEQVRVRLLWVGKKDDGSWGPQAWVPLLPLWARFPTSEVLCYGPTSSHDSSQWVWGLTFMRSRWCSSTLHVVCHVSW